MIEWGFAFDETWFTPNGENTLSHSLETLVGAGFTWWEVPVPPFPTPEFGEKVKMWQKSLQLNLSVHSRFIGTNLASPYPPFQEAAIHIAREDLQFASSIGARRIVFHAGSINWYDVLPPSHNQFKSFQHHLERLRLWSMDAATTCLEQILPTANQYGIEVFLENLYMPWEFPRTSEEVARFLTTFAPSLGFAFDVGHATVAQEPCEDFLALSPGHLHLHGNDGHFDLHWMPRATDDTVQTILSRLPRGIVILEVSPLKYQAELLDFLRTVTENGK